MVQFRKQNRRLLSPLDDFDQNVIIGNAVSSGKQNVVVNSSPSDRELTVNSVGGISTTNETTVKFQTLENCLTGGIDREMVFIRETVEEKIQNAILKAVGDIVTPVIELAIMSVNT